MKLNLTLIIQFYSRTTRRVPLFYFPSGTKRKRFYATGISTTAFPGHSNSLLTYKGNYVAFEEDSYGYFTGTLRRRDEVLVSEMRFEL